MGVQRQRVLFVLPRLVSGGVERVTLHLIRKLQDAGTECALAVGKRRGELLAEANAMVCVHDLAGNGWRHFVPRLSKLIDHWKPTVVVTAFADVGLMSVLALKLARHRPSLIHGVHDTLGIASARPGTLGRLRHAATNVMARAVFRRADAIVAVSEGVRLEVAEAIHGERTPVYRIYNPVLPANALLAEAPVYPPAPLRIVGLGRLVRQKGFDLLVEAMGHASIRCPWTLDLYGDGPMRGELEARIAALGLADRIKLHGFTAQPLRDLEGHELFVMPSRHEGLGNVLVEAMSRGLQVIAADCPHGPREILDDGAYGTLVPPEDVMALAKAIEAYANDGARVDPAALLTRAESFTNEIAFNAWKRVIEDVMQHKEFA